MARLLLVATVLTGCASPTIPMDREPRLIPTTAPVPTTAPSTTTTTPSPTTTTTEAPAEPEPVPTSLPPVLVRIGECESSSSYTAENPTSTASGRWQVLDSTAATLASLEGYDHASDAPPHLQDAAAIELYERAGTQPWAASASCWR